MQQDPWAFGWTPLLTLLGFAITIGIAVFGFRTFGRWRREKLEDKKIEMALEAMALAHECRYVFASIRNPMSTANEWSEMPRAPQETDEHWRRRGPYYAIAIRISQNREFFERLFKLQPKFMALFGAQTEEIFVKCHQARRYIEASSRMLMQYADPPQPLTNNALKQRNQWEADIWEGMDEVYPGTDRVTIRLRQFQQEILALCEPVVRHSARSVVSHLWNNLSRLMRGPHP